MTFADCLPVGSKSRGAGAPDVFIAMPVYSGLQVEFTGSLLEVIKSVNSRLEFHAGDSLITRSRNNVVHSFLQTDIPWLLFLDTDLVFPVEHITRLLSHGTQYPLVGGCYPKKKLGPAEWVCNVLPGAELREDGLQEVGEMGTGMLKIHRSVFGALREAYPQLRYKCDGNKDIRYDFFPVGTFKPLDAKPEDDARYLSEDWYICQLARAIGFKIWADTKCTAQHIGIAAYPLDAKVPDNAEANKAATVTKTNKPNAKPGPPPLTMELQPRPKPRKAKAKK